jgi:hypothetical protein
MTLRDTTTATTVDDFDVDDGDWETGDSVVVVDSGKSSETAMTHVEAGPYPSLFLATTRHTVNGAREFRYSSIERSPVAIVLLTNDVDDTAFRQVESKSDAVLMEANCTRYSVITLPHK